MPTKSMKKVYSDTDTVGDGWRFEFCDILVVLILVTMFGFTFMGVYKQTSSEEAKLQEESILCIKDFDSRGCNPFNMTAACQERLECIKQGDGLGVMSILEITNKHIKNNGAIPIFMIFLGIANEIRRRLNQ